MAALVNLQDVNYGEIHDQNEDLLLFENQIEVLDVKGAAGLLKVSEKTIYKLVTTGELPSKKIGKGIRFLKSQLIAHLKGG